MKLLKNHLSLIFALVAILLGYQTYVTLDRIIVAYEKKLSSDYSLVVASSAPITVAQFQAISPIVTTVESIDPTVVLNELKNDLSPENFLLLRATLPKFYRVRLSIYPSEDELSGVVKAMTSNVSVMKVESFAKTQNKIFQLLTMLKNVIMIFLVGLFAIGVLLMVKQMEVWRYQHSTRMMIMEVFGAPLWLRSLVLYRMGIVDAFISSICVSAIFKAIELSPAIGDMFGSVGLSAVEFNLVGDFFILSLIGLSIAIISITFVVLDREEQI
jgi:cell division transport system permease protein